ncbi:site-2 protease family protein [Candidatus Woesearchaeota archaeon]|nr:site-2 protease family protein [Candidatus Woesearchaeota archaeon]
MNLIPKNYKRYKITRNLTTSNIEIKDLLKSWIFISVAFAIVLGGLSYAIFKSLIITSIVVGTGFLLHELAHKIVAQKYKMFAEFRAFNEMLFLALIMSLFGFVIAAPGAVMIANKKNLKNINGKISIAGPLTNIFLSLIFVLIYFISTDFIQLIAGYGARINIFLALFNMIPFSLFDGAKIFKWSKLIWFVTVLICIFLLVLNFKYIGVI